MSVKDVAEYLGEPERNVRLWASNGKLLAVRCGEKPWRFRSCDIEEFSLTLGFRPAAQHFGAEMRP